MIKRILTLLLAFSLLLSLAACGGSNSGKDDTADNAASDSAANNSADKADTELPPPEDSTNTGTDDAAGAEGSKTDGEETADDTPKERVIDPSKPMVALTYDDGPHKTYTDAILDILEEHGAVATFFEVARNLSQDPDAVRRAEAMGCEVGSHSLRHDDLGKKSESGVKSDTDKANEKFMEVLGHTPALLRPPYGSLSGNLRRATTQSLIMWSVDTLDWKNRDPVAIMDVVKNSGDLNGDVILMHSIHETSVEATKTLIPWLIEQGYQLVTVSELITLHYGEEVLPNGLYNYGYFSIGQNVQLPPPRPAPKPVTPVDPVTPPEGGEVTPPEGGEVTPPEGGEVIPPEGGEVTPPEGGEVTPPEGGEVTPPESGEVTPPEGGEVTPPESGETTPPATGETTPPATGETPPPAAGETPPPAEGAAAA